MYTKQMQQPESDLALLDVVDNDPLLEHLTGSNHFQGSGRQLTELERVLCFLVAQGSSYEDACFKLGLPKDRAESYSSRRDLFDLVLKIQTALRLPISDRIRALAPVALERKMKLVMFGKNENVVNAATSFILEQSEGKATQRVEVQSLNLNALAESKELDSALQAAQSRLSALEDERNKLLTASA